MTSPATKSPIAHPNAIRLKKKTTSAIPSE
jgi:hypothetical protein